MNWDESFIQYAEIVGRKYLSDPDDVFRCMKFKSVYGCLHESYSVLIKGGLTPIEHLPLETKESLWNRSAGYAESKSDRIKVCESIYLLEEITK